MTEATSRPRPADLPGLIATGLAMVEQRLARSGGAAIYDSVQAQLTYLQQVVRAGAPPTADKLHSLTLGSYAAREFETSDPEFADVLFTVEYLAKRL